jgi:hypothetical protein
MSSTSHHTLVYSCYFLAVHSCFASHPTHAARPAVLPSDLSTFKRHRALNDNGLREEEGLCIIACRRRAMKTPLQSSPPNSLLFIKAGLPLILFSVGVRISVTTLFINVDIIIIVVDFHVYRRVWWLKMVLKEK